jgi:flagella basal body P-ring formation protein FlgA
MKSAVKLIRLLVMLGSLLASSAFATTQSLDAIRAAAESFVRSQLPAASGTHFITAATLDPRLRLQPCSKSLEAFANSNTVGARSSIGVRCTEPTWTIYVPVTVEVEAPVLVLRRALARNASVTTQDVEVQVRRLPGSAATFVNDISRLDGQRLKRSLAAGAALTVDALTPDILVRRGQLVTLIAQAGGVEIRAQGQALTEGGANERIRVRNASSNKIVEGVVESGDIVRVGI